MRRTDDASGSPCGDRAPGQLPAPMIASFGDLPARVAAPDPRVAVDVCRALGDADPGTRPARTVGGLPWRVDALNAVTQAALLGDTRRDGAPRTAEA